MTTIQNLTAAQLRDIIAIKEQIETLQGKLDSIMEGGHVRLGKAAPRASKRGRRRMSAAGRAKIAAAAKARWARYRAEKGEPAAGKKRRVSAEAKAKMSAAAKARWAKAKAAGKSTL